MTDTTTTDDICGAECVDGSECQNPAGSCGVPTHSDPDAENNRGRPKALTDERVEALYEAAALGLKIKHQAAIARVDRSTLNRAACCLKTLRDPELTTDDPCDFCDGYVRAHGRGAMETLQNCKPEFVASATFGYNKTEGREVDATHEHSGTLTHAVEHDLDDETRTQLDALTGGD